VKNKSEQDRFDVWLICTDYVVEPQYKTRYNVVTWHGGPLEGPLKFAVHAIYRTEQEAREAADTFEQRSLLERLVHDKKRYSGLYEHPIAYVVMMYTILHEEGPLSWVVFPCCGGEIYVSDDRDIVGVFATLEEDEAFAKAKNGPGT